MQRWAFQDLVFPPPLRASYELLLQTEYKSISVEDQGNSRNMSDQRITGLPLRFLCSFQEENNRGSNFVLKDGIGLPIKLHVVGVPLLSCPDFTLIILKIKIFNLNKYLII